jgi:hypothetical protein
VVAFGSTETIQTDTVARLKIAYHRLLVGNALTSSTEILTLAQETSNRVEFVHSQGSEKSVNAAFAIKSRCIVLAIDADATTVVLSGYAEAEPTTGDDRIVAALARMSMTLTAFRINL